MSFVLRNLYSLVFACIFPIILFRFFLRNILDKTGHRKAGPKRRFFERFGWNNSAPKPNGIIFHMVSVGEALAAINLIKDFQQQHPTIPITVTCTTQQGSKIIRQHFGDTVFHCYLPYDFHLFHHFFLHRIRAKAFVILETELWPNLIHACDKKNIKLLLFNGRLSERSYKGYAKVAGFMAKTLNSFYKLGCQAEADAARFKKLGVNDAVLDITGNLKFDLRKDKQTEDAGKALKTQTFQQRPIWIAASTHPGEDEILLAVHKQLLQTYPELLLIIAPRHIERTEHICNAIKNSDLHYVIHTEAKQQPQLNTDTHVYVVNTIGELLTFYACSDIAFIGGSLIPHGGHNPIEPALFQKAIISGKHYFNFQTIYNQLQAQHGVKIIADQQALENTLRTLLENHQTTHQLGQNAYAFIQQHTGATKRYLELISPIFL